MSHRFFGEDEARPLVEWLNQASKPKQAEILNLLLRLLLVLFGGQFESISGPAGGDTKFVDIKSKTEYGRLLRRLQRELRALHKWPELSAVDFRTSKFRFQWASKGELAKAKLALIELAMMGGTVLGRLNQCKLASCRKWFFAKFKHQNFCCTPHQQSFYRNSDEWRAGRRRWAKENRIRKATLERGKA